MQTKEDKKVIVWVRAIYEVDPDTNEANGIVHPFCSHKCIKAANDLRDEIEGREFIPVESATPAAALGMGSVCETCGKEIGS